MKTEFFYKLLVLSCTGVVVVVASVCCTVLISAYRMRFSRRFADRLRAVPDQFVRLFILDVMRTSWRSDTVVTMKDLVNQYNEEMT